MQQRKKVGGSSSAVGVKPGSRTDVVCASARCSINNLYGLICRFDDAKKRLVQSIGFSGILYFPALRQINRRFVLWIMSRVEPLSQTLVIDDSRKLKFQKSDVGKVFGIPCSGLSVAEMGKPRNDVVASIKNNYLGIESKDNRSIKAAQEVIQRDYGQKMTVEEENAFKAAFLIYVMATLLCPGAKSDYASVDYWNAIIDTDRIGLYDWSQYVIQKLVDAVVKVRSDLEQGNKVPNITGCTMFLQVFYLDSIDVGIWNLEHRIFPRIRTFNSERLKSMILADAIPGTDDSGNVLFGKSKFRAPGGVCYQWAAGCDVACSTYSLPSVVAVWEATKKLARTLRVPLEAAGPLYHGFLEYDMEDRASRPSAVMIISSLLSMIEPYLQGFRYKSGVEADVPDYIAHVEDGDGVAVPCHTCGPGTSATSARRNSVVSTDVPGCGLECETGSSINKRCVQQRVSFGARHVSNEDVSDIVRCQFVVTKAMSKYFLGVCQAKRRRVSSFGLGGCGGWCNRGNSDLVSGETSNACRIIEERFMPEDTEASLRRLMEKFRLFDDSGLERMPCFIHYVPKYIEVLSGALKS